MAAIIAGVILLVALVSFGLPWWLALVCLLFMD